MPVDRSSPSQPDQPPRLRFAAMVAEHERRKWSVVGDVLEVLAEAAAHDPGRERQPREAAEDGPAA